MRTRSRFLQQNVTHTMQNSEYQNKSVDKSDHIWWNANLFHMLMPFFFPPKGSYIDTQLLVCRDLVSALDFDEGGGQFDTETGEEADLRQLIRSLLVYEYLRNIAKVYQGL